MGNEWKLVIILLSQLENCTIESDSLVMIYLLVISHSLLKSSTAWDCCMKI